MVTVGDGKLGTGLSGNEDVGKLRELIDALQQENKKLKKRRKYGLVWEDKVEELDKKGVIPLLDLREDLSLPRVEGKPNNYLIVGDNYHSLKALQFTHKGKIDVIYIDPPYNTGNEFVYNDKLVDKDDGFRHSKWLSFMEKRLKLARNLMSNNGVIFVSIDDNEQAQLKLLMDNVFGEHNFVAILTWNTKREAKGIPPRKMVAVNHEYILVYGRTEDFKFLGEKRSVDDGFSNPDKEPRGPWKRQYLQRFGQGFTEKTITNPMNGDTFTFPTPYTQVKLENWIKDGRIIFPTDTSKYPARKEFFAEYKNPYKPIVTDLGLYSTKTNSEKLKDIFDGVKVFDYTKPIDLIKYLLRFSFCSDALILDFFAGSGTTGHAVMELNKEDGGNRSFILCTNNEVSNDNERKYLHEQGQIQSNNKTEFNKYKKDNESDYARFTNSTEYTELGIARAVTRERIKRVIEGYTTPKGDEVEGLPNNLTYLQTHEFPSEQSKLFGRRKLVNLALNSHYLKYPKSEFTTVVVDVDFELSRLDDHKDTKPLVVFLNVRDTDTLKDYVEKLVGKYGNELNIETFENYFENKRGNN